MVVAKCGLYLRKVGGSGRWNVTEQNQLRQEMSDVRKLPVVRSVGRVGRPVESGNPVKAFCGRGAGRPVFSGRPMSRGVPDVR